MLLKAKLCPSLLTTPYSQQSHCLSNIQDLVRPYAIDNNKEPRLSYRRITKRPVANKWLNIPKVTCSKKKQHAPQGDRSQSKVYSHKQSVQPQAMCMATSNVYSHRQRVRPQATRHEEISLKVTYYLATCYQATSIKVTRYQEKSLVPNSIPRQQPHW